MRNRTRTSRTITVRPTKPRNLVVHAVVQAVVQRLGTLLGSRHDGDQRTRERLARMDLDQRVREIGEW